jgi:mannose-6-phosphate isomerase-like protein (cupin superfamily)
MRESTSASSGIPLIEAKVRMRGLRMSSHIPDVITLSAESSTNLSYDNHPVAHTNDHVVRIATMTEPYHWHFHPNSDETFLVLEGRLAIEFEDGTLELHPGQLVTIPRGVRHRTRPVDARSVNLTFELAESETVAV